MWTIAWRFETQQHESMTSLPKKLLLLVLVLCRFDLETERGWLMYYGVSFCSLLTNDEMRDAPF